ncbi:hypothetical protein [Dictyobacter aurantiacus]|nr:hypothetical protein [Dictyobacter aurantiacus]
MARHIQQGERPVVFYGQDYMGVLEAYIGAMLFSFMGSSVFALRLGMTLFYVGFLVFLYLFVRQIYTEQFALWMVALFGFGSTAILSRQLVAIGGYIEVELFVALAFTVVLWPAFHPFPEGKKQHLLQYLCFFLWAVAISVGLWSYSAIIPWIACSGLLLLIFCWRELLLKGGLIALLAGLLIGSTPLIIYNVGAQPGHDTLTVLFSIVGKAPLTLHTLKEQILNTFTISFPIISGEPTCHKSEYLFLHYWGFESDWSSHCMALGAGWSLFFGALGLASGGIGLFALGKAFMLWRKKHVLTLTEHQHIVRLTAHLLLLLGVVGVVVPYLRSMPVLTGPGGNARYLLGTWIGFPALLWPLWAGGTRLRNSSLGRRRWTVVGLRASCVACLTLLLAIYVYGSWLAVTQLPLAKASKQSAEATVQTLQAHHVTHIYAEYWFTYRIAFYSNEQVTGASYIYNHANDHTLRLFQNKYTPYLTAAQRDPYASYVIPASPDSTIYISMKDIKDLTGIVKRRFQDQHLSYRVFSVPGYTIYQPIPPNS